MITHSKEEDWAHLFSLSIIRRPKGQPLKFREEVKKKFKNNFLVFYSIQIKMKPQGEGVGTRPNTRGKIVYQTKVIEMIFPLTIKK